MRTTPLSQEDLYPSLLSGIFTIFFASNALETVNKTDIKWSTTTENTFNPTAANITFSPEKKIMFGLGIIGFNLNDPSVRYFDITMK